MHPSAYSNGQKFFERYWQPTMSKVLEMGSYDVNGTLRDLQPAGSDWVGVDLEAGPSVDLVVAQTSRLPFADSTFDVVLASSVLEHDSTFWLTFNEMVRVVKDGGYIYLNVPSNGLVHRHPVDVYRFYPDAGKALLDWGALTRPGLSLVESFVGLQNDGLWNDFCAVFGMNALTPEKFLHTDTPFNNLWLEGEFVSETFEARTEDFRIILHQQVRISELENQLNQLRLEINRLTN